MNLFSHLYHYLLLPFMLLVTFVPWATAFWAVSWAFIHLIGATLSEKLLGNFSADIAYVTFRKRLPWGSHSYHSGMINCTFYTASSSIQAFFFKVKQNFLLLSLLLVWYSLQDSFALGLHHTIAIWWIVHSIQPQAQPKHSFVKLDKPSFFCRCV